MYGTLFPFSFRYVLFFVHNGSAESVSSVEHAALSTRIRMVTSRLWLHKRETICSTLLMRMTLTSKVWVSFSFTNALCTHSYTLPLTFILFFPSIFFLPLPLRFPFPSASPLLLLSSQGACGGAIACSTCHVIVDPQFYQLLPPPSEEELDMLDLAAGLTKTYIDKLEREWMTDFI